jgi:hypothetical protein
VGRAFGHGRRILGFPEQALRRPHRACGAAPLDSWAGGIDRLPIPTRKDEPMISVWELDPVPDHRVLVWNPSATGKAADQVGGAREWRCVCSVNHEPHVYVTPCVRSRCIPASPLLWSARRTCATGMPRSAYSESARGWVGPCHSTPDGPPSSGRGGPPTGHRLDYGLVPSNTHQI